MSTAVRRFPARATPARLRFLQPTLPPIEQVMEYYQAPYSQGLITNGSLVARLESEVAERLGVKHCVAVSSCTSGLTLTLRALDVKGEVILPSFTFFATGHALLWNGLTPVFADCEPETWTLDPDDVERKMSRRTSAILGVHLYGNPCDTVGLNRVAARHGVRLIYDAAHAFGSLHSGRPVGQFGDAEVFSLSPTKLLVAGEGGLVTTNDATLAHRIRAARNYGDLGAYDPELLGLNARMSEFHAALALAGLGLVDRKVGRHNEIASRYTERLSGVAGISFQAVRRNDVCAYKDYSVLVNPVVFGLTRDALGAELLSRNIETKKYFHPPLHDQRLYTAYAATGRSGLRETDRIASRVLSLPIYESLTDGAVESVAGAIAEAAGRWPHGLAASAD